MLNSIIEFSMYVFLKKIIFTNFLAYFQRVLMVLYNFSMP